MKRISPAIMILLVLILGISGVLAQDTTTPATTNDSNVAIFFVACETGAVVNLSGTMGANLDVFYQVFSGAGGTGTALTGLRQVQVSGAYAFSEQPSYTAGSTVAAGAIGSIRVVIARETDSTRTAYETTVDDLQDGCNSPQNPLGTSLDINDPNAGAATTTGGGSNIQSPLGGTINPGLVITPEPVVVIGARGSLTNPLRSATPGQIFATCDQNLPGAAPGVLYDSDNILIFWSWYAKTEQQVQDHLAQAQYSITLNSAILSPVVVSNITQRGSDYFVFYSVNLGRLRVGQYGIQYKLNWAQPISDGYADFGPGTPIEEERGSCGFKIVGNPNGENVTHFNELYSIQPNQR